MVTVEPSLAEDPVRVPLAPRGRRAAAGSDGDGTARRPPVALSVAVLVVAFLLVLFALPSGSSDQRARALAAASLWLLAGGLVLRPRHLLLHVAVAGTAIGAGTIGPLGGSPGLMLTLLVADGTVLGYGATRQRIVRRDQRGESMLVDLRDRLQLQGSVPRLEPGWQVETELRSAHGESFSGDFLVATRSVQEGWVELVLVDVSGKGRQAGTRALMLSGAFGGMLGALPAEGFLPAANRYVLRQCWQEGFATAVHLALDMATGTFRIAGAGHPPAARFRAGSGRWELVEADQGPVLGVLAEPDFPCLTGILGRGDALLLYTDGLVETPGRDLDLGIDRLMGQAERAMARGFHGGAETIVNGTRCGDGDDRALVLIWRS
jgi:serine phosphatase RsbU (regulator of sigma subunit)